ncbi:MAG: polysaccharide export protein [Victivallales bacterium]|nr:polysaccharide export protein [Victivallales bacterium]
MKFKKMLLWALLTALTGCYPGRMTNRYNSLVGNVEKDNAVLEETGQDEESERKRMEFLKNLYEEDDSIYHINAGDKLEVRVYGQEELNSLTRVSPDGYLGILFAGQIKVSGKTIAEASAEIEKGLSPYIKHPVVGISVVEVSSETVTMGGSCSKPGLVHISAGSRLADAYAQAGGSAERLFNGVDVDVADLEHSILVRDGKVLPVDFQAAIMCGDPLNNVKLHKGDYIFIAQRMESSITICGEVGHPHRRLYEAGMGLIETLTAAGWMKDTHWNHVIIIRDGLSNPKMYKIDVDSILNGSAKNVHLKANDIVYVPKDNLSEFNVFVHKLFPTAELIQLLRSKAFRVSF